MSENLELKKGAGRIEVAGYRDFDEEVMIEISREFTDESVFFVTKSEAVQIIEHLKKVFEL